MNAAPSTPQVPDAKSSSPRGDVEVPEPHSPIRLVRGGHLAGYGGAASAEQSKVAAKAACTRRAGAGSRWSGDGPSNVTRSWGGPTNERPSGRGLHRPSLICLQGVFVALEAIKKMTLESSSIDSGFCRHLRRLPYTSPQHTHHE